MLAKMGVGRGDTPEVSPLLRAEDGRVGELSLIHISEPTRPY